MQLNCKLGSEFSANLYVYGYCMYKHELLTVNNSGTYVLVCKVWK
jgi:hypothetical protein